MKYKALMLDVDGTLIPYEYDALPSQKVIEAIKQATDAGIVVCLVTGRAYDSTKHILDALGLTQGVIVTNSGGGVFDIESKKPLHVQPIDPDDVEFAINLLQSHNIEFYIKNGMYDGAQKGAFKTGDLHDDVYMIFVNEDYTDSKITEIYKLFESRPHITVHKTKHKNPKNAGINLSHVSATKLHGVEVLMKHFNLKREEIIGVGDAYNDFPLLMASGLKVAMGNAIPELKEVADYVAPDVKDDGVAFVIDKFILNHTA